MRDENGQELEGVTEEPEGAEQEQQQQQQQQQPTPPPPPPPLPAIQEDEREKKQTGRNELSSFEQAPANGSSCWQIALPYGWTGALVSG